MQINISTTAGVGNSGTIFLDTGLKFINGTILLLAQVGTGTALPGANVSNVTVWFNRTGVGHFNYSASPAGGFSIPNYTGQVLFNITIPASLFTDGNYSFNISAEVAKGDGTIDQYFNTSWNITTPNTINGIFIVDNTAPVGAYTGFADGSSVSSHSVNISVNFTDVYPSTITFIFANTTTSNTTTMLFQSSETGNLSYNFSFYVYDGNYTYNVSANDTTAHRTVLATRSILIDRTSPTSAFLAPTEANNTFRTFAGFLYLNMSIYDQNITFPSNLANITFGLRNSTFSNSTTLYLRVNGANATTNTTLNFSYTGLSVNSQYLYNVTVYDQAGNLNVSETRVITLDNTNPQTAYDATMGVNNTFRTSSFFIVNATVFDANLANITFQFVNSSGYRNGSFQYLLSTNANTTTNVTLNISFLSSNSQYLYNVTVYDRAGNVNTSETRVITLDNTNPASAFLAPTEANNTFRNSFDWIFVNVSLFDLNLANITFGIRNSTSTNTTVVYLLAGNANTTTNVTFNFTRFSSNSQYLYNVTVYDQAGNVNVSETSVITLDNTNPQTAYDATMGVNNTFRTSSFFIVNATVFDANLANITFQFVNSSGYRNGSFQYLLSTNANTTTNVTLNISFLSSNSQYLYNVTVYDQAGNVNTSETRVITLDNTQARTEFLAVTTPANNSFRIEDTLFLNVSLFDANLANITFIIANGTYSNATLKYLLTSTANTTINTTVNFSYVGLSQNSQYLYNVTVYDQAGNVNVSETRVITFDNTLPVATMTASSGTTATLGVDVTMTCAQTDANPNNVTLTRTDKSGNRCTGTSSCTDTFNAISYDSPTFTCATKDKAGNAKTVSFTFDRIDPPTSGGSSGGGGGGGGGGGSSSTIISSTPAEQTITAPISTQEVRQVTFTLAQAINGAKVNVQTTSTKPASVPAPSGTSYSYFEVSTSGFTSADVKKSQIKFAVPTKWLKDNRFTTSDIALYVYRDGVWKALQTTSAGGDETSEFFTSDTGGFSTFAIIAKQNSITQKPVITTKTPETQTAEETAEQSPTTPNSSTLISSRRVRIFLLVLLIAVILALLLYFIHKKQKTHPAAHHIPKKQRF